MKNALKKNAVENINQTYGFPLPNSKSRIYVKYTRPQTHEGSISVLVSGWITDVNKNKFEFNGALVKSFGANFKDVSKDLTNSLEEANEKAGNPIADAYEFVNTKIIPSVPYDAMDDFFKGIKHKKKKPQPKKEEKVVDKPVEQKPQESIAKNTHVKINMSGIKRNVEDPYLYDKILKKNPDIEDEPYGLVFKDNGNKAIVIFNNKTYEEIPKKFLLVQREQETDLEKTYKDAYEYYMAHRTINPGEFKPSFVQTMIEYKKSIGLQADDIDKKLLGSQKPPEIPQEAKKKDNPSWIKNIFTRNKKV